MKKFIVLLVVFSLILSLASFAYAKYDKLYVDPISISYLSGAAYALMDLWGIEFAVSSGTPSGVETFMNAQIEDYADRQGSSIADLFGAAIAVDTAGKLIVGQVTYNAIKDFVIDLVNKFNLGSSDSILTPGEADGTFVPTDYSSSDKLGITGNFTGKKTPSSSYPYATGYGRAVFSYNGATIYSYSGSARFSASGNWSVAYDNYLYIMLEEIDGRNGDIGHVKSGQINISLSNQMLWNGLDYVQPTVIDSSQEYLGNIDGYSQPDTNLDQLMGGIFDQVSSNDINIEGEVVDIPVPPTPAPTIAPDIPLSDVPWEGLNDLIGSTTGTISEGIQEQTGAITEAQEATTEAVSDLTDVVTEALTAPEIEEKTFDLRELFPFCIPFDIYHLLQKFDGTPSAPHVQLPIVIPSIGFSYTMDLDFSAWDPVAAAMRTVELIVYALALAWATSKVIKW